MSGPLLGSGINYLTIYTLTETAGSGSTIKMVGTPTDFAFIGTHTYRIKCINGGSFNILSNMGDPITGFFKSVYSDEFKVKIEDPCVHSIVNFDGALKLPDIEVSQLKSIV